MKRTLSAILTVCLSLGVYAPGDDVAPDEQPHARVPQWAHLFTPPSREQVAMRMMVRQLLLNRYDADANLELDGEERERLMKDAAAARRQQALAFIRRFDADGDGKLSPEEHAAMQAAMKQRRTEGDGEENTEAAPHEARPEQPAPRVSKRFHHGRASHHGKAPHPGRRPHGKRPHMDKDGRTVAFMVQQLIMDAYDADKNGTLGTEESARLREDGAKLYAAREAELLARYDADQNGRISEGELQDAADELFPRPNLLPHRGDYRPRAEGELPPPPPRHKGSLHRLLDTHFDLDILVNLAHPQD